MEETVKSTDQNIDKRKANLKEPWQPGQSGNPNGRPKKEHCISSLLDIKLHKITNKKKRATLADEISNIIISMAKKKDRWALETILDRTEGKAKQDIQLTQIKDQIEIE